jgi:hypothetical protein
VNPRRALIALLTLLGSLLLIATSACGATEPPLGTAAPTSTSTTAAPTSSTGIADPSPTDITLPPMTAPAVTDPGGGPTTTVLTGTTLTAGSQEISLTFVGPMTVETWRSLRGLVNGAAADGDKVRAAVAKTSVGPDVAVKLSEIDRFSGIGFAAGANTSQPIAVATDGDGQQVLVYAFSITGDPDSTTVTGFDRETGRVGLVEGPLEISDSTQNITTSP